MSAEKNKKFDPMKAKTKIESATKLLISLGLPREQQNDRSALTLLALVNIKSEDEWKDAEERQIGITPIMDFCRDNYHVKYAPNTRETFRRYTMHQFVEAGIAIYNPDKPSRPVNSPKACYQITPEALKVIRSNDKGIYQEVIDNFLKNQVCLKEKYGKYRAMEMIPVKFPDGKTIELSPGKHNELIKQIIDEFAPRFAPASIVIALGDTENKLAYFDEDKLKELGVIVDEHGKLPDVILYQKDKNWLFLVESVTSHGPVNSKRHSELTVLFKKSKAGLVYVTAFPDKKIMGKYLHEISWETEVWIADSPTHLIHFNGDRFLGPHKA